jgi:large subunit ribosomal protein L29
MKVEDIRRKKEPELAKDLKDLREKLRDLKFNLASGKVKDIREVRAVKRDIARILTIINEEKK